MSIRERILSAYRGETPDVVPYMGDLSHWFYATFRRLWDLSQPYEEPEYALIDYHKKAGVGFYIPNLAAFYSAQYGDEVKSEVEKHYRNGNPEITWRLTTPLGVIERTRIWEERSYSWAIGEWGVKTERDLCVLGYALGSRTYAPLWERFQAWSDYVGEDGVVYLSTGYSAMGYLLSLWMGVEGTVFAANDWRNTLHEVVERINANGLELVNLLATSPADVIIMGDNFSADIQPPHFFNEWSRAYYTEAIRRLHAAGKFVAVHIDGRLGGAITMIRNAGADFADGVTPTPTGDLTPLQCRQEAGRDFGLSGGIPSTLWLPEVSVESFKKAVIEWLELRRHSPRLIATPGEQVPPGAVEDRIRIARDLIEEHGKYE